MAIDAIVLEENREGPPHVARRDQAWHLASSGSINFKNGPRSTHRSLQVECITCTLGFLTILPIGGFLDGNGTLRTDQVRHTLCCARNSTALLVPLTSGQLVARPSIPRSIVTLSHGRRSVHLESSCSRSMPLAAKRVGVMSPCSTGGTRMALPHEPACRPVCHALDQPGPLSIWVSRAAHRHDARAQRQTSD